MSLFTPISSSSPSSSQLLPPSRILVNLLRPKCFCGFTSVSLYPESPSSSSSVRKTNWVYECHFTPNQIGMVKLEPCEDCEDGRERVLARTSFKGSTSSGNATMRTPKLLHQAEKFDQVELWPSNNNISGRRWEARGAVQTGNGNENGKGMMRDRGMMMTATTTGTTATGTIGEDLGRPYTFQGLAPTDREKVCGFHMHALEWHHMQTVGLDEILATARQAKCSVFNFSVVRWLGDKVRTNVTNNNNNNNNASLPSSSTSAPSFFNRTTRTTGLSLKLFQKISCECGSNAVIAKGPTMPSHYRSASKEDQFLIVCSRKAHTEPQYEIVGSGPSETFYRYHDNDRARLGSNPKIRDCISISIDFAIFWIQKRPIHERIETNEWLSQWLPPSPNKARTRPSASPVPSSFRSSRLSRPTSISSRTLRPSNGSNGVSSPRLTDLMVSTIQSSLALGETRTRLSPRTTAHFKPSTTPQTTTRTIPSGPPPSRLLTVRDFGALGQAPWTSLSPPILPKGGPMQEQKQGRQRGTINTRNGADGLGGLDRELEEVVAWHVAEVTSIMKDGAAQDNCSSPPSTREDYCAPGGKYCNYKDIDMTEYPGIAMHLCQWCRDNARDFCVVPSLQNQPGSSTRDSSTAHANTTTSQYRRNGGTTVEWSFPPSPPQSPDSLMDTIESDRDRDIDMYTELERVDRELERVMRQHAVEVQEAMESRSRLLPGLLQCRGCEYHTRGRDVLPCCHALLCIDCVDAVEFYLVPRTTTTTTTRSSFGLYE